MNWLEEILLVLAFSTRTQFAILLGVMSFIFILTYGYFAVDVFELIGLMAPLTEVLKPYFAHRYEAAAFGSLFGFMGVAVKLYKKDRKRLLGTW